MRRHFIQKRLSTVSNGGWFFEQLSEMEVEILQEIILVDEATFFSVQKQCYLFLTGNLLTKQKLFFFSVEM